MEKIMKELTIAFASDDGKNFMDRHFGDSDFYYIYKYEAGRFSFMKKISNNTEEEDGHADPVKAGNIGSLLKKEGVNITVSKIYGPNIKRIKKKFVCIVAKDKSIESAKEKIVSNITKIIEEWEKGEQRAHLQL